MSEPSVAPGRGPVSGRSSGLPEGLVVKVPIARDHPFLLDPSVPLDLLGVPATDRPARWKLWLGARLLRLFLPGHLVARRSSVEIALRWFPPGVGRLLALADLRVSWPSPGTLRLATSDPPTSAEPPPEDPAAADDLDTRRAALGHCRRAELELDVGRGGMVVLFDLEPRDGARDALGAELERLGEELELTWEPVGDGFRGVARLPLGPSLLAREEP